jgi:hypothetical protein
MAAILDDSDLQILQQQEAERRARALQSAIAPPSAMPIAALPAPVTPPAAPKVPLIPPPSPAAPQMPGVTLPAVSPRVGADIAELDRLRSTGSGLDQFAAKPGGLGHKLIAGLGRVGDIGLSALFPSVAAMVPGTALHHSLLMGQAAGNLSSDQATEQAQSEAIEKQAKATQETAKAKALTNPQPKRFKATPLYDKSGAMIGFQDEDNNLIGPNSPNLTPDMKDLLTAAKPKPVATKPAHVSYDSGIPVSVTAGDGSVYDVNDPKLPDELKPLVASAVRAHGQHVTESADAQARAFAHQDKLKSGAAAGLSYDQLNPSQKSLVDEIGSGKMVMGNLDRVLTKNPDLMAAVAQKYPDFDQSKIKSYLQAYRDFTGSGKISTQLNAGSTALRHLAQLKSINDANPTAVHNPLTESYKQYNNLLDTVVDELVTFYGEPKTNEAINAKKATLGGYLNRGAAITEQAKAMGEKFDELENTWKNAAPSQAYQAPMPGYSQAAKQARAKLDSQYAGRLKQESGGTAAPAGASDEVYVNGKLAGHVVNGAYVPLAGGR